MARKLEIQIVGDNTDLERKLAKSEKALKKFGGASDKQSKVVSASFKKMAGAATGVAAGYVSIGAAKSAISTTEDLAKTTLSLNKNLGLSVKTSSEFAAVLKARGADTKQVAQGFAALSRNVEAGKKGTETAVDMFERLGVSQRELKTLKPDKLIGEISNGMKELGPGTERTALSAKLFGKSWQTLGPLLRGGKKDLADQLALADKYGATFGDKSVKGVEDLIKAQRESKLASEGLSIAFGTKVAPALTKGINAASKFVAQMRSGEGTGGRFAKKAGEVADKVKSITSALTSFGAKHTTLVKVAGGIVAVGLALRALRFGAAITGLDKVGSAAMALGRTKAGQKMKQAIINGLGGLKTRVVSILGGAGDDAGGAFVSKAGARVKGSKWSAFKSAGKLAGAAFGVAAALAISKEIEDAIGHSTAGPSDGGGTRNNNYLGDLLGGIFKRKGGRVGFQGGGMVPSILSPGELGVLPNGSSFTVPGARVAADTVPMALPVGTSIFTDHGQSMLASGASMSTALARQAPHFAKGGRVQPFMSGGKVAQLGYNAGFRGNLQTAVAIAGAESGWNENNSNQNSNGTVDRGLWQINSIHGSKSTFDPKKNAAAAFSLYKESGFKPWVVYNKGTYKAWMGKAGAAVKGIKGVNDEGPGGQGRYKAAAVSHPLLGTILSPLVDDALGGGITAGMEGTSRTGLLSSVLEGIVPEASDYATKVAAKAKAAGGGKATTRLRAMLSFARKMRNMKIPYGPQGHSGMAINPAGEDCSSSTSKVLHAGGALNGVHTTVTLPSAGLASGPGKLVTIYNRPLAGDKGHMFGNYGGHFFGTSGQNPGGGPGFFKPAASYVNSFPQKFHPKGMRRGGRVGMKKGGILHRLAGSPGNKGAASLTLQYAAKAKKASERALLTQRRAIRAAIRKRAKHGLTGAERIQVRRLRGAYAINEDALGRPIGNALGKSDAAQAFIDRDLGNLSNYQIAAGIDPESAAGIADTKAHTASAIGLLSGRQAVNQRALARAKRTGNAGAIKQAQDEVNEVADQLANLTATMKGLDATIATQNDRTQELIDLNKQVVDNQNKLITLTTQQGPQILAGVAAMVSGNIGGKIGIGSQTVGYAGGGSRY